jgi:3-deoxy-D-manno-octulosonate 8-phosphate phosphatase (KDO 8-P phosphatase)
MSLLANFTPIQLFVLDVDGVLTDGSLLVFGNGEMVRRMNIKEGYALQLAIKRGYQVLLISGGQSEAVRERLVKLGVTEVHMNVQNKSEILMRYVTSQQLAWSQVLYMGDDIPDLKTMQMVGLACCPADAVPEIKAIAHYISPIKGGEGCVRDVIEKVLKLNQHWAADDEGISSR